MKKKVLNLTYASTLTEICEKNSSFDSGVLQIAYPGENQNKSYISKESFEKALESIYNCPIVCNYDRDSDTLGGHDMALYKNSNGDIKLINLTTPIGVIPESAKTFWQTVVEDDGTEREYLCAEALLWKRQEAYDKIKQDGYAAQSMEITVKDGESKDGLYHINDFEFTAFALIGVEPCFESASLEFSKQNLKEEIKAMMQEYKESFSKVVTSKDVDNIENSTKGGTEVLEDNNEVTTVEAEVVNEESVESSVSTPDGKNGQTENFELQSNMRHVLAAAVEAIDTIERSWGGCPAYWMVDYDAEIKEVYCTNAEDYLLYGFAYDFDNDDVVIDKESKKRKKYEIVDYIEGVKEEPWLRPIFEAMEEKIAVNAEAENKYQEASNRITELETTNAELAEFKANAEKNAEAEKKEELFAQFEDLKEDEAFVALVESANEYSIETLEEKCYAIRGRRSVVKFNASPATPKLKVENNADESEDSNDAYGGLFTKYAK